MSITLPKPDHFGLTVEEALRKRRSVRQYSAKKPLKLGEVSELLFAAQGITGKSHGTALRTAPSAGALYPMEVYLIAHAVDGLSPGVYHYDPQGHELEPVDDGDKRSAVAEAGMGQEPLREAGAVIALTGVFSRTTGKYGERGIKYVYVEAGHVAQNVLLQAVSLELGAVPIGAFYDDRLNGLLNVDINEETALYLIAVGRK